MSVLLQEWEQWSEVEQNYDNGATGTWARVMRKTNSATSRRRVCKSVVKTPQSCHFLSNNNTVQQAYVSEDCDVKSLLKYPDGFFLTTRKCSQTIFLFRSQLWPTITHMKRKLLGNKQPTVIQWLVMVRLSQTHIFSKADSNYDFILTIWVISRANNLIQSKSHNDWTHRL